MARIAIIHIPDDHTADTLMSRDIEWPNGTRLVGVFAYPTTAELTCEGCVSSKGPRAHSVRDEDGAMICSACGSQPRIIRQLLMRSIRDYLGCNLLTNAPKAFRTE